MEKFFIKYPKIFYDNVLCCDITRRVRITNPLKTPNLFYPLELNSGMRSDQLSDAYYEDSELDWLILMTNDIVDPYYQWYLDEVNFDAYIVEKYGTIEYPIEHIKFYRNNWYNDSTELSPGQYDNYLSFEMKKYYSPNYGQANKIISYSRKKVDWVTNTNKILQYELASVSGSGFSNGEIVDIKYSGEVVGGGEVITSNSTVLYIQHVSGNTHANTTWTKEFIGEESATTATVNTEVIVVQENITNAEANFWSSVSIYDYEQELNESKKHLKIMNSSYALDATEAFRKKLKE